MAYYDLMTEVNSEDTLTQEQLYALFMRASHLVSDSLDALCQENSIVQYAMADIGAELACNIDRNRSLFSRKVAFYEDGIIDSPPEKDQQDADFLCQMMDLQLAMVNNDLPTQRWYVKHTPLSRMVLEGFISNWLWGLEDYVNCSFEAAAAHNADGVGSAELELKLEQVEHEYDIDSASGFALVRYVQARYKAIKKIYELVFNAYARVVFKQARLQAVSTDHALDCHQNGSFGLMRAISSYDFLSNAKFVGHARWWIKQSMLFRLKEESNLIKVSANVWQNHAKLEAIRSKHEAQHGPLSQEELASISGYSEYHIENIYGSVRTSQVRSLDHPLSQDGEGFTLLNLASVSSTADASVSVDQEAVELIRQLLGKLKNPEHRRYICLNFGLVEHLGQTLNPYYVEYERLKQLVGKAQCKGRA